MLETKIEDIIHVNVWLSDLPHSKSSIYSPTVPHLIRPLGFLFEKQSLSHSSFFLLLFILYDINQCVSSTLNGLAQN